MNRHSVQYQRPSHTTTLTAEARNLFHRRKIAYVAIAAIIVGLYILVAIANDSPSTSNTQHISTKGTAQGDIAMQPPKDTTGQTNLSVRSDNTQSVNSGAANTNQTTVVVNGQNITVPANGTLDTTVTSDGNNAFVHVSHTATSTGSAHQSSTFTMEVNQ